MKYAIFALLLAAGPVMAATAYFTGNRQSVTSVTGRAAWNCEYQYGGQRFWQTFVGNCPNSVEIQ